MSENGGRVLMGAVPDSHERCDQRGANPPGMRPGIAISTAVDLRVAQEPQAPRAPAGRAAARAEGERVALAVAGAEPPRLGKITKILSDTARNRRERRDARFDLREVLQHVTSNTRVHVCGVRRIDGSANPEIRMQDGVAHFARVMLCGLLWICPVCGPKIRATRATDLDLACAAWIARHGVGSVLLLTLTIPHDHCDSLAELLAAVKDAFTSLVSGRAWKDDKDDLGLKHWVRAHDVTVGLNGWHPHLHVVLLADSVLSSTQLAELSDRLYQRWVRVVTNRGYRAPSREHGIQLEQARSRADTARYVCQVVTGDEDRPLPLALEVARGDLKTASHAGHRTPWQVLGDFAQTGDEADLRLWHEWELATHGVQAIRWSNGLRAEMELGVEATDEEVVQLEVGGEVIYVFDMPTWSLLCRTRGGRAMVLRAAEQGGSVAVNVCLSTLAHSGRALDPGSDVASMAF